MRHLLCTIAALVAFHLRTGSGQVMAPASPVGDESSEFVIDARDFNRVSEKGKLLKPDYTSNQEPPIYFVKSAGDVLCADISGALRWKAQDMGSLVAVSNQTALFRDSQAAKVVRLTDGHIVSSISVHPDDSVIPIGDHILVGAAGVATLYNSSFKEIWATAMEGTIAGVESQPDQLALHVADGSDERLVMISIGSGKVRSSWSLDERIRWFGILGGNELVAQTESRVVGFIPGKDAPTWSYPLVTAEPRSPMPKNGIDLYSLLPRTPPDEFATAAITNDLVIFPDLNGLHFLDRQGRELQKPLADSELKYTVGFPTRSVVRDGTLYLFGGAIQTSSPIAFDPHDGRRKLGAVNSVPGFDIPITKDVEVYGKTVFALQLAGPKAQPIIVGPRMNDARIAPQSQFDVSVIISSVGVKTGKLQQVVVLRDARHTQMPAFVDAEFVKDGLVVSLGDEIHDACS